MKSVRKKSSWLSAIALTALCLTAFVIPASATGSAEPDNAFTFTNTGVSAAQSGDGYEIDGTALTVTAAGEYVVTGTCANGSISVAKDVTGVTLTLRDLSLTSTETAPLILKSSASATLNVSGNVTLSDRENPNNETSDDPDVADAFEGAAIKLKKQASLIIKGDGALTADGSACKNGIKGGAGASVTVRGGVTLIVTAKNNGIASDGNVTFDGGKTTVTSGGDAIKSEPDADDEASAGTVLFNFGSVSADAGDDGVQATNGVEILGGSLEITSVGDGIQSGGDITVTDGDITIKTTGAGGDGIQTAANLNISGGAFDITTFGGYQNVRTLGDNSAKGLKASSDADEPTNEIKISGGTFRLNTADDAIHSDYDVTITGGQFTITTGDDGAHADSTLTLGTSGGVDAALRMTVVSSYEGLEGSVVNILSGCYDVTASDDGINAAGGSASGYDPGGPVGPGGSGGGPGDRFGPGGGFGRMVLNGAADSAQIVRYDNPRSGDAQASENPRSNDTPILLAPPNAQSGDGRAQLSATGNYAVNISGGVVRVNANGDGLDANGNLNLTGGQIVVWGQQAGYDNEPLDYDGTLTVKGATVFAAGGAGMGVAQPSAASQASVAYRNSTISTGKTINVKNDDGAIVYGVKAIKNVNYVFFSSPDVVSGWAITSGSTSAADNCAASGHTWDAGTESKEATCAASGTMLYTCTVCGETKSVTIPALGHHYAGGLCVHCGEKDPNAASTESVSGYAVTFRTGSHASVTVYATQTISDATLDDAATHYARNASTGAIVADGNGQCNFVVTLEEGYRLDAVTASGKYGQVVTVDAENGVYRVTKIAGNITVTLATSEIISKAGFFYDLGEASATVRLGYEKIESVTANAAYQVGLGWYDSDGRFLKYYAQSVTLDADKYAELETEFPEEYGSCFAFLMSAEGNLPAAPISRLLDGSGAISLSKSAVTLNVGDELTLTAYTITDVDALTWSVADEEVVSAESPSGYDLTIKAIASGETTVTVTGTDEQSAVCTVTVAEPEPETPPDENPEESNEETPPDENPEESGT